MTKRVLAFAFVIALVVPAFARAESAINLALFNPIQITKESESVTAFRFSLIYGRNANMQGLDLSLVGQNTGSYTGLSLNGVGMVDGDFTGGQIGWLASIAKGNMQGLQTGAYTKSGSGSSGVQWGIVNTSDDFSGLQFGLVNIAETMRSGLQIGLVNIINNKDKLKILPIVNWRF